MFAIYKDGMLESDFYHSELKLLKCERHREDIFKKNGSLRKGYKIEEIDHGGDDFE